MFLSRKNGNINSQRSVPMAPRDERYVSEWAPVRPGADDHERVPSRRGSERVWRNGKREAA